MNFAKFSGGFKKYGKEFFNITRKNSPTILSATAIAAAIGSFIALWKLKDKVDEAMEEYKADVDDICEDFDGDENAETRELKIKELKKECAVKVIKHSIPFAVLSTTTIACIIGSVTIGNKRLAAVSAAYTIAEKNLDDWKKKAKEMLGDTKAEKIDAAIAEDRIKANYPDDESQIVATNNGDTLFYDEWSGRFFRSSIEYIKRVQNDMNYRLITEDWLDLNEFYYALGLGPVKAGHEHGWNINYNGQIEIKMIPRMLERNGMETPVVYLEYNTFLRDKYC